MKFQRKQAIIAAAIALAVTWAADSDADKGDITLHTVSVHIGASDLNNINPGLAVDVTDNLRVGAFYNSYRKPSAYALGFFEVHPRVRVGAGVMSGYTIVPGTWQVEGKTTGLIPAVAVEVDITKRLSLVWFGQAVNLEVKF